MPSFGLDTAPLRIACVVIASVAQSEQTNQDSGDRELDCKVVAELFRGAVLNSPSIAELCGEAGIDIIACAARLDERRGLAMDGARCESGINSIVLTSPEPFAPENCNEGRIVDPACGPDSGARTVPRSLDADLGGWSGLAARGEEGANFWVDGVRAANPVVDSGDCIESGVRGGTDEHIRARLPLAVASIFPVTGGWTSTASTGGGSSTSSASCCVVSASARATPTAESAPARGPLERERERRHDRPSATAVGRFYRSFRGAPAERDARRSVAATDATDPLALRSHGVLYRMVQHMHAYYSCTQGGGAYCRQALRPKRRDRDLSI